MRDGWKETRLRDLCADISYGYTTSATDKVTGVKFLRITDVVPDFIDWSTVPYCEISPTNYEKTKLEVNDIVIARTGATVGYAKQIKKAVDAVNASYLVRLRLNDKANKKYIGVLVESDIFKSFVRTIAGGSAQPNANAKDLTSFKFLLPPLPLQTRIADLLSAYDELIELNNRRIALLEQTAEQLYKEWFVRLRFPGYEQTKVRKGVPEGWSVKRLSDICQIMSGGTPRKKVSQYWDGNIPFFTPKDVPASVFCFSTDQYITEVGLENCNSKLYPELTIMLTARGTVGKVAMLGKPMAMNQSCFALKGKEISPFYTFLLIKHQMKVFKAMANGATFDTIILKTFDMIKVNHPTDGLIEDFHQRVMPIFHQIQTLQTQNQTLRRTRDLLLPRLISGQLSVAKAETALNA